jgi:hypothetical protein
MNNRGSIGSISGSIYKMPPRSEKAGHHCFMKSKWGGVEAWKHVSGFACVCVCLVLFLASMLPHQTGNHLKSTAYTVEAF